MNGLLIIAAIVLFALAILKNILPNLSFADNASTETKNTKKGRKTFVFVVILAAILCIVGMSIAMVPTGYTGVRVTFGQISSTPVQNGINLKIPIVQQVKLVNNKQQEETFGQNQIWSETSTRTALYYSDITVTYQILSEKSAWLYANVSNYEDSVMNEALVSSAVKSSSKELPDDEATNRSIIEPLVQEKLQESVDQKFGSDVIVVNKVVISGVDFEDSYNQAIAEKQQAQLKAEQQAIENQKEIEKAEADAQVKKTTAQAEADALLIEAEANAKANELLENSLSDKILRQQYIEKWNGELPKIVTGDDSSTLMLTTSDGDVNISDENTENNENTIE